jgi:hypothetical protein
MDASGSWFTQTFTLQIIGFENIVFDEEEILGEDGNPLSSEEVFRSTMELSIHQRKLRRPPTKVQVRLFGRCDNWLPLSCELDEMPVPRDERQLYSVANSDKTFPLTALDGHAIVLDNVEEANGHHNPCFYVSHEERLVEGGGRKLTLRDFKALPRCHICWEETTDRQKSLSKFLDVLDARESRKKSGGKLRTLDLFSGAGGLSTGGC